MTHRIIFHKIFFFISITVFAQNPNAVPVIQSVEIKGAENFSESRYINWSGVSSGTKIYDGLIDTVKKNISYQLSLEGYYNFIFKECRIEKHDSLSGNLIINIDEGTPTYIRSLHYTSGKEDSLVIKDYLDELSTGSFGKNRIFSRQNLDYTFNRILDFLENNGYPFAKINLVSTYFSFDTLLNKHFVDLWLNVDKELKAKIDYIEISGNTKTNDDVILKAAGIREGEIYSQKIIDDIPARLNKLNFFEFVEKPSFYFNSRNEGILSIKIKERQTNNFDGIVGYVPSSTANERGYFTGFVNIGLRNLFGTGRGASIRWQQENPSSQELELHYLEPWLLNYPFNLELGLFQRKQDSTYVQRSLDAKLEFLATDEISASLLLSSLSTIPTERKLKTFTVFNSSSLVTGVSLKIDTRSDLYSPTKGILFISNFKSSIKKINGPANYITSDTKTEVNYQRIELDMHVFHELFNKQVVALGLHARELKGNDFEISDLYLLGGVNTLRGYREKQFQGNRIFWSNLEYRYLLESRSFIFLFFDSGYYLRDENQTPTLSGQAPTYLSGQVRNISRASGFKIGYGLGLNIETGLGVMSISFALGQGDSFSQAKVHFGIVNQF